MRNLLFIVFVLCFLAFEGWTIYNISNTDGAKIVSPVRRIAKNTPKVKPQEYIAQPLSLDGIFLPDHGWTASLSAEKTITMIATGDVIPARMVNWQTTQKNNFLWPWEKTVNILKKADITFINLESPLLDSCQPTNQGMVFCGNSKHIDGLKFAGIDVANLANNHAGNYGPTGIEETKSHLQSAGVIPSGLNGPIYKKVKNIAFGFLGYNALEKLDTAEVFKQIQNTKNQADVLVVAFHWGAEYTEQPDNSMQTLARQAVDFGADLVIGNHPHWIKPMEIYRGKVINYGLGNFIFDQEWSQKTKEGVVGKYIFYNGQLVDAEFLPIMIKDFGQPYFLEGQEKNKIISEMITASE